MSDKPDKKKAPPAAEPAAAEAAPAKKKPPIKMIGIVGGMMVAQGVGVYMLAKMTSPKSAVADVQVHTDDKSHESYVEIPLIEEKFQNLQSGRPFIWDVSIVLKVKAKDETFVTELLQKQANEVKEGISLIFRRAPHTQLMEAGLETLNRQIYAYLNNEVIEKDAEGKPRVSRVLIPKCKGFPAD